ncbi:eukaryotic translation initiation factor 2-alpha kinase 4-like [Plakobranchus ocellatus]|uniref:Eukaryotic translation initiation factor 2-alpha kinase 4-like n=1 Tax=Plakobranchus ocellatus TaxID=259542 RepID=A0AAV4DTA0_9GAST|nr:eukaryotic translation initiation factor 2-alpha kinase 4-like [Plakobranchus ocellatus]
MDCGREGVQPRPYESQDMNIICQMTLDSRLEIAGKASTQYPYLPEKNLEVLALDMPTSGIKIILAYIELNEEALFEASIAVIMEKQSKFRKYLVNVFDQIHDLRFQKRCNFIFLYSIKDETLKLLTATG